MGNNWAILIGINQYEHLPKNKQLKYAVRDVEQVHNFLCTQANFALNNVLLCTDNSEPLGRIPTRPSRNNLIRLLTDEIERAKGADNFWFFFSGHGVLGRDKHDYLLTCDGYPRSLELTAISVDFVIRCLVECQARSVVLILDMCRDESWDGSKSVEEIGAETIELAKQQGITTIFSCSRGEESYEISELQQGSFTYALLEGLNPCSTPKEIEQHLIRRTTQINLDYGKPSQTPIIRVEPGFKYELPLLYLPNLKTPEFLQNQKRLSGLPSNSQSTKNLKEQVNRPLILPSISNAKTFNFEVIVVDVQGKEVARCLKQSQCLIEDLGNAMFEMVVIPDGTFLMGSTERKPLNTEIPIHSVTVKPFLMSKNPVTKAQWKAVASLPQVRRRLSKLPSRLGGLNHPITQISWLDAIEFCSRLSEKTGRSYRLPTEAEWEYACRAGTTTPFHFGATITPELANYDGNFPYHSEGKGTNRGKTTQVDNFQFANAFGLFDMHGNVWEWCQDFWHENYENAPLTGEAWLDNDENFSRVMRGGSWLSESLRCRSACRQIGDANHTSNNTGFRIACDLIYKDKAIF